MNSSPVTCPDWLINYFKDAGGVLSFAEYMDLALNHSLFGSYSSGKINIGKDGDFVTSPSLSSDFAELLSVQVFEWFKQLSAFSSNSEKIALIEIGPGEGHLSFDLINALQRKSPDILEKIELILVEVNNSMRQRQFHKLSKLSKLSNLNISWKTLDQLAKNPPLGVVIAHEVLDALPVERIVLSKGGIYQQGVSLVEVENKYCLDYINLNMPSYLLTFLEELSKETGVSIPPEGVKDGWSSELHENLSDWFEKISKCIRLGPLLIVDYSINAKRYYHPNRDSGTIISYKDQFASSDVLKEPGESDITAHLCIESIEIQAKKSNLELIEKLSQEEALLNLGWGERYALLRKYKNKDLAKMLDRRESLLRLIDPTSLGNFMWHIFQVNNLPNHMIDLRKTLNLKIPKSYPLG